MANYLHDEACTSDTSANRPNELLSTDATAAYHLSEFGNSRLQHSLMDASCTSFASRENCVVPKSDEYQQPAAAAARSDTESGLVQFELFDFDKRRIVFSRSTRSSSNSSNGSSLFGSPTASSTDARSTSSAEEGYDSTSSSRDVSPFGSPSTSYPIFRFAFPAPTVPLPMSSSTPEKEALMTPSSSPRDAMHARKCRMPANIGSFNAPTFASFNLATPAPSSPRFNSRTPTMLAEFSSSDTSDSADTNPRY